MIARTNSITRGLAVGAAVVALTVAGASPALADPPPAAAGTTSHGFVATRGAITPNFEPHVPGTRAQPADPPPELPAGLEMWKETR